MTICATCNSTNVTVTERIGSLETWRCEMCGKEETVHVSHNLNPVLPSNLEPVFQITGHWLVKPTTQKITTAQRLFPQLRKLTVSAILRLAITNSAMDLGRFTASELIKIADQIGEIEINITRTPL